MQRDAEDADAPRRVLDHHQDAGLGAVEQVDGEEVARQDRLGLRTQELRPSLPNILLIYGRGCNGASACRSFLLGRPSELMRGARS